MLIIKMYQQSQVVIGKHTFSADLGVVQGGVLSPMLFNVYLEEALGTTLKLREMVNRGDLLAFADAMLILTNSQAKVKQAIQELDVLNVVWNLRLIRPSPRCSPMTTYPILQASPAPTM